MRIFVTGTGRCGTSTFYQACKFAVNYTVGHESLAGTTQDHRYPDNHIEVSSQLVPAIPILLRRYPEAKWVHLIRRKETCVESLVRQCWDAMEAYAFQWFQARHPLDVLRAASLYYDYTNATIESLLSPHNYYKLQLEEAYEEWPTCFSYMGLQEAVENRGESREIWRLKYNPSEQRGRDNFIPL